MKANELEILREVEEILVELNGMDETGFIKSGIKVEELLSPTMETLINLRKYRDSIQKKDIETLDL